MQKRVIVITGASAGVGRATARRFAREKASITLIARGADGLEAAAREVRELGGQALVISADVADAEAMEAAAALTEEHFGPIDVWVNNAMVSVFSPVKEMEAAEFKRVTEVTYLGYVYGTLAALKRMLPRDHGTILQVGSALAYRGIPLQSAYCAAKHAVQGFNDSLRCELLHDGSKVKLSMIQLPALNTPQFGWVKSRMPRKAQPVPPIFQPVVAAEAIVYASHHPRREFQVGWSAMKAILGNRLVPLIADHKLAREGIDGQQTDEAEVAGRPHNLWQPVPGDHGACGAFSARAAPISMQLKLSMHRKWLAAAGVLAVAALVRAASRRNGGCCGE
jgi:NAD(P)-dependent dehydrogenase (short-subunit alcohol dehydrogenase family)